MLNKNYLKFYYQIIKDKPLTDICHHDVVNDQSLTHIKIN